MNGCEITKPEIANFFFFPTSFASLACKTQKGFKRGDPIYIICFDAKKQIRRLGENVKKKSITNDRHQFLGEGKKGKKKGKGEKFHRLGKMMYALNSGSFH